jgi:putative nucleotidyltransferase with HDIG domain
VFIREAYLAKHRLMLANQDLLYALVKAIETRDPYTSGHARRVQDISMRLGSYLRIPQRHLAELEQASLLHDIGKIEVMYEDILKKPSALTIEERLLIESHVHRGVEILRDLSSFSQRVIEGVRHHHELYDGSGYPDGLEGKDIPLFGRIIKISDAIDAMLSDRPYRQALPLEIVREELNRFAGVHFDPEMVAIVASSQLLEQHHEEMEVSRGLRDEDEAVLDEANALNVVVHS